jgi:hypothetical protein
MRHSQNQTTNIPLILKRRHLGPEECLLPGSVNASSNTFSLEPEEWLLPGSVNVSSNTFSLGSEECLLSGFVSIG